MEQAGFKAVGWCEIDKYAQKSYRAIHDTGGEWFASDIAKVTDQEIENIERTHGKINGITAGFPCNAFSFSGKRRGFEDPCGTLFFEILRFANILKPDFLLLENVKGILNHKGGETSRIIFNSLAELGFGLEWQILNSKNYVCQNRERIYIIGYFGNRCGRQIFPIRESNNITCRQIATMNWKGIESIKRVYDPEYISPTITTMGGGHRQPKILLDKDGNFRARKLTPKECWLAQGFPTWAFEKAKETGLSDSQLYKQSGNAVTIPVVYEIAKRLYESFF
jgi:DNA (cytosine-5)-methyltransferase 1